MFVNRAPRRRKQALATSIHRVQPTAGAAGTLAPCQTELRPPRLTPWATMQVTIRRANGGSGFHCAGEQLLLTSRGQELNEEAEQCREEIDDAS